MDVVGMAIAVASTNQSSILPDMDEYLASLPEWQDDQQVRSLFASFAQPRNVNPEAYDTRLQFWQKQLLACTSLGYIGHSVFRLPEPAMVAGTFSRKGSRPLGIAHVMVHLTQIGLAEDERPSAAADSLIYRFARLAIARPISSGWRWISGADSESDADDSENDPEIGPLLLTSLIKVTPFPPSLSLKESAEILIKLNSERSRSKLLNVISYTEFTCLIQEARSTAKLAKITDPHDFRLLLEYLKKKKLVSVMLEGGKMEDLILRIKLPEEPSPKPITNEEINLLKMRAVVETLDFQLQRLSEQIESARQSAKTALKSQDRQLALHELRRSKTLENVRNQRLSASSTIHEILIKIDSAQSDSQIFEAYKIGEQTLKSILKTSDISPDKVDDVMLSLQEAITQQNEVALAITAPLATGQDATEEELEQELAELIGSPHEMTLPETILPSVPLADIASLQVSEEVEDPNVTNSPVPE